MTERIVIGNADLIHGDCAEVLPMLGRFDLILTDPPYGIFAHGGKWGKKSELLWDQKPANNMDQLLVAGAHQIIWGGNYFTLPPSRGWLTWFKPDAAPSMAQFEMAWTSFNANARQIFCSIAETNAERVGHPTQKPIRVMRFSIGYNGNHETVCDPYMGSGTTGVACAQMGKRFTGIEKDRKYFDIACERIENAQRQGQMFAPGPAPPPLQMAIDL